MQSWSNDLRLGLVTQGLCLRFSVLEGIVGGGSECTTTEVRPLSKVPNPQQLPSHCSKKWLPTPVVCLFTAHCCVCALGWDKCKAQIPNMGYHTLLYHVTSLALQDTGPPVTKLNPSLLPYQQLHFQKSLYVNLTVLQKNKYFIHQIFSKRFLSRYCF